MKQIIAVDSANEFSHYQELITAFSEPLSKFVQILHDKYELTDLPKAILWTTPTNAMNYLSDHVVAAYTNDDYITMTPEVDYWQNHWQRLMAPCPHPSVVNYLAHYDQLSVIQIAGHEIAHHCDIFLEEWDEKTSIWFEEGMVEFLSSYYLLSSEEFTLKVQAEQALVNYYAGLYGEMPIDDFTMSSYDALDETQLFVYYWQSFITIAQLVEQANMDIGAVIRSYKAWCHSDRTISKYEWLMVAK